MKHVQKSTSQTVTALEIAALQEAAGVWAAHDPDPATATALQALIDDADPTELADSFAADLHFGTAGLRAAMGPGPNRMNKVVVRRAAAGVAAHLLALAQKHDGGPVPVGGAYYRPRAVVGFDARHNSREFAQETAAIFTAAGIETFLMLAPLPTPVLAYAVRSLACEAGIMVTASHNPKADNGYKVYLGGRAVADEARGVQIVAPHDALIAGHISDVAQGTEFGDTSGIALADDGWTVLGQDLVQDYVSAAAALADAQKFPERSLRIVHTSLHGVGHETALAVLERAGFTDIHAVPEQAQPDPEFPTVAFPNPEEPGAMDLAFALARDVDADLVIANDPDADRAAVGVRDPATGQWHQLHGDQVGALLGAHLVTRGGTATGTAGTATGAGTAAPVFANSIVSSRLLAKIAAKAGYEHMQTLTGFKWISRVPGLSFGYEEALGYCVAPNLVRDKDGISAGLLIAELAAGLKAAGRTLFHVLDELALEHGLHASTQISIRVEDAADIHDMMSRLRTHSPTYFDDSPVAVALDLAVGTPELPPTDGLAFLTQNSTRVIVRPSGTEPKLKCYLEVIVPVASAAQLVPARDVAQRALAAVVLDVRTALGLENI